MPKKEWPSMATDEKLEALREDIATAYKALNGLIRRVDMISNNTSANFKKLADKLDSLEIMLKPASRAAKKKKAT